MLIARGGLSVIPQPDAQHRLTKSVAGYSELSRAPLSFPAWRVPIAPENMTAGGSGSGRGQ